MHALIGRMITSQTGVLPYVEFSNISNPVSFPFLENVENSHGDWL